MKQQENPIQFFPLSSISLWQANYRQGDLDAIKTSIKTFGFRSVVRVWNGTVMAGNHAIKALTALKEEGWQPSGTDLIKVKGKDWLIPAADISSLSEDEAVAFAIADNRTQELGENQDRELYALLSSLSESQDLLEATGYDADSISELLASIEDDQPQRLGDGDAPEPQMDRAEELREKWGVEYGQLWEVGRHRILCGDSTKKEDVERLMGGEKADMVWTDPPYGVSYVGKTKDALTIENDELDEVELEKFLQVALGLAWDNTKQGGGWYVAAPAGPLHLAFAKVLHSLGVWRQTLQWVKSSMVLGRSDYHYKNEPIFYGWKPGAAHLWNSDRTQTTVLEFDKPNRNEFHPTMKPVDLVTYCIGNSSKTGEIVLDCFNGSGTTLVASEMTQRCGRSMELDPKYVAVTLERLSEMGLEPRLINS